MGKLVRIADVQAQRLEQMAAVNGATESALVEQGIKLLFRQNGRGKALCADREALLQLEAEGVLPALHQLTPALHLADYQMTHAVQLYDDRREKIR